MRRGIAVVVAASLALSSSLAHAEPSAEDRALATSLFKEGKALMDAGKLDEACPKLVESHRLDPAGGTILNAAVCHEKQGRTATAWSDFAEALALAKRDKRDDRIKLAEEHIAALEPKLSKLILVVPPESGLPALRITRDGSPIGRAAWGGAIPTDPGKHTIEASAPGKRSWQTIVEVGAVADTRSVTIPKLDDLPDAPRPIVTVTSTRTIGVAVSAMGLAWLGAGTFFGLRSFSLRRESDRECVGGCSVRGATLNDDAKLAADASTVSFVVGLASLGVGAYLFFRPSTETRVMPVVGHQQGALVWTGSF